MVAINHYGMDEEEEVDSLVRDTTQENTNTSHNTTNSGILRGQHPSSSSFSSLQSSSTIWKGLALILVGVILLFVTDSIEIKRANKGELVDGNVQLRSPSTQEEEPLSFTDDTDAGATNTKSTHDKTITRYTYQRRGQPMPQDMHQAMISKWGEWKMTKERPTHNNIDFYKDYPHRDVPRTKFPTNAWQLDKEYMTEFLTQGQALVKRAMEAILAEYGHGVDDEPGASFETRSRMFQLRFLDLQTTIYGKDGNAGGKDGGAGDDGGWTTHRSWAGLKRRLWHAIMTEDSFIFAMGGHSAAAGHGNHFSQSYTLQVAWIMEPIFSRLGVKHQSRNFGFGGLGTLPNAIAGGSLYGPDVDLLMWDAGMTEKAARDLDLMARQGLIGGAKVPVLWSFSHSLLKQYEKADIDVGLMGTSSSGIPSQDTLQDIETTVWATKYMNCQVETNQICRTHEYNSTCWIERPDLKPARTQKKEPGDRQSWHPGNRIHQLKGRTLAMTILQALHEVLVTWSEAEEADGHVLSDDDWHVTDYYKNQREKIQALDPKETGCGEFEKNGLEHFCTIPFKGRTEYTPRAYAAFSSIRTLMPRNQAKLVNQPNPNLYEPPDVFNPVIHPPLGEVDVLNIVESGPAFQSVVDPEYTDYYGTLSDHSTIMKSGKGIWLNTQTGADQCDGTINSWCNRGNDNDCLLYGRNDKRGALFYDSYSGWMVLKPKVKYGYVTIAFDSWHGVGGNEKTDQWTSINNEGKRRLRLSSSDEEENELLVASNPKRELKTKPTPVCEDFRFEWAIDGKVTSLNHAEFLERFQHVQRLVDLMSLMSDPDYTGGEEKEIEVAIRIFGCGRDQTFALTHIYYA